MYIICILSFSGSSGMSCLYSIPQKIYKPINSTEYLFFQQSFPIKNHRNQPKNLKLFKMMFEVYFISKHILSHHISSANHPNYVVIKKVLKRISVRC